MLVFDPENPFPLLTVSPGAPSASYGQAQSHSEAVDSWLGLETARVETELTRLQWPGGSVGAQLWIGLPVRSLLTPYTELRSILARLNPAPGSTIVDLGAGYGRMAFVIARHFPEVRFVGYERVAPRVLEARRCLARAGIQGDRVRMEIADLSDPEFTPESAEAYFLYDFGAREAIDKTLEDLKKIARSRIVTVVGRGRASRDAIERGNPWLSQIVPPEHSADGHWSIYRSGLA